MAAITILPVGFQCFSPLFLQNTRAELPGARQHGVRRSEVNPGTPKTPPVLQRGVKMQRQHLLVTSMHKNHWPGTGRSVYIDRYRYINTNNCKDKHIEIEQK